MNVDFVLIASGNINLPSIHHGINFQTPENAKLSAQEAVAALSKAGYTQFTLYDTRRLNGDLDKQIATFRVAHQEPHIIMN